MCVHKTLLCRAIETVGLEEHEGSIGIMWLLAVLSHRIRLCLQKQDGGEWVDLEIKIGINE